MAINSIREQLIANIVAALENVNAIKTVERRQPEFNALQNIALTQYPMAAVVGLLPKPVQKISGRSPAQVDKLTSVLAVDVFVYAQDNVTPDETISSLLDDVWVALYADETRGGLAIGTDLEPEPDVGYWAPYIAFKVRVNCTYIHDTGGI